MREKNAEQSVHTTLPRPRDDLIHHYAALPLDRHTLQKLGV